MPLWQGKYIETEDILTALIAKINSKMASFGYNYLYWKVIFALLLQEQALILV